MLHPTPLGPANIEPMSNRPQRWQWTLLDWAGHSCADPAEAIAEIDGMVGAEVRRRRLAAAPLCPVLLQTSAPGNWTLEIGNFVQVRALAPDLATPLGQAIAKGAGLDSPSSSSVPPSCLEHPLWVKLTAVNGDVLTGVVDTLDLLGETGLQRGDTIRFSRQNVEAVEPGKEG